jgi:hypothetical protein
MKFGSVWFGHQFSAYRSKYSQDIKNQDHFIFSTSSTENFMFFAQADPSKFFWKK